MANPLWLILYINELDTLSNIVVKTSCAFLRKVGIVKHNLEFMFQVIFYIIESSRVSSSELSCLQALVLFSWRTPNPFTGDKSFIFKQHVNTISYYSWNTHLIKQMVRVRFSIQVGPVRVHLSVLESFDYFYVEVFSSPSI